MHHCDLISIRRELCDRLAADVEESGILEGGAA
jgi:hypothetical protein